MGTEHHLLGLEVERRFPSIPWREPLPVKLLDASASGLACRICIAVRGLHGSEVGALAKTREEFDEHMKQEHPL